MTGEFSSFLRHNFSTAISCRRLIWYLEKRWFNMASEDNVNMN